MRECTWEQLLKWYNEALAEYESAVEDQMLDDEEHDRIESLRYDVEDLEEEINSRLGEFGSLFNPDTAKLN